MKKVRREQEPDKQANHRGKVNAVSSPRNVDGEPNKIKQSTLKSLNNRERSELGGAKRNFNAKTKSKQGAKHNSDANQKVKTEWIWASALFWAGRKQK